MKSKYVCKRCGVAVGQWAKGGGVIWKHQANRHTRSCHKPPKVVTREGYAAEQRWIERECEDIIRSIYE
jgi:hypothetical protein